MFPSGLFGVAFNAQAAVYHPLAHGAEGIVVEGVHGVVSAESVGVRIGVEAFPDGCGALCDGIEPRGVGCVLQQAVGHVGASAVGEHAANPRGGDEACHQGIGRALGLGVGGVGAFNGAHKIVEELGAAFALGNAECERKHIAALYVNEVSLLLALEARGYGAHGLRVEIGLYEEFLACL